MDYGEFAKDVERRFPTMMDTLARRPVVDRVAVTTTRGANGWSAPRKQRRLVRPDEVK